MAALRPAATLAPLALAALLGLGACRAPATGDPGPRGGEVAIGLAAGAGRSGIQDLVRGVELAVDQLNRDPGRRRIRFVMRRAPDSLTGAVQIATALRDDPAVVGVVGHPESGATLDAAAIYADDEGGGRRAVVAVSPTASSPSLSGRSAWIFRICPTDGAATAVAARHARDSLGARRASIIYRNDAYGKDWARAFAAAWESLGGTVVHRDPYVAGITEWSALARYVAALAPDVVVFPGSAEDAGPAIGALREAGVTAPVIGGDAIASLDPGAAGLGGVHYTSLFQPAAATSTEGRVFVTAYRARFGDSPGHRSALAYDAAMIIGRAVLAAGGADRRQVRDRIAALSPARPHRGATGAIAFNADHDVVGKPVVMATIGRP